MDDKFAVGMDTVIDVVQALNAVVDSDTLVGLFREGDLGQVVAALNQNSSIAFFVIGRLVENFAGNGAAPNEIADAVGIEAGFVEMFLANNSVSPSMSSVPEATSTANVAARSLEAVGYL